jgi:hypothetical protein
VDEPKVFGYIACRLCDQPELEIVGWKTNGLCATCFRAGANRLFTDVVAHHANGERTKLSLVSARKSPGERRRRRFKSKRERTDHERKVRRAEAAALRRLKNLYPDVYEVLVADERAERGIEPAWTVDRAVTPHHAGSQFEELATYAGATNPMAS